MNVLEIWDKYEIVYTQLNFTQRKILLQIEYNQSQIYWIKWMPGSSNFCCNYNLTKYA